MVIQFGAWLNKMLCNPQASNPDDHSRRFSSINQDELTGLMKSKDLKILGKLNGVEGLAKSLGTTLENGSDTLDIERRKISFGSNNTCKKSPIKGFFGCVLEAFKDANILIQLVCAALSIGLGIKENGAKEGWYEGGSIFMAAFLVIAVSSFSNFRQDRHFDRLSKRGINNITIDAIRDGRRENISIFDVVVGDVIILNTGDQIPADGLFIDGDSLIVDESSMTGESDHIDIDAIRNPFLLSGSKVAHGHARMLAILVGMNTTWGKMMSGDHSYKQKPTISRLNTLISSTAKISLVVTLLDLVITSIRYATGYTKDTNGNWDYHGQCTHTNEILNSFTRFVTALPEGLSLTVTLTLSYSINRMIVNHVIVRKLSAGDTLGSATVICSDKTGTLTMNDKMMVTNLFIGLDHVKHDSPRLINPKVLELIHQGARLYTTAAGSVYSSTEKAILSWAVTNLGMDKEKLKQDFTILHVEPFNSEKRRSGVSIKKKEDGRVHVHWKGDAEVVLAMCSHYYQKKGSTKSINSKAKAQFKKIIQDMAKSGLRCIAFAYKKNGSAYKQMNENQLTLLGIVGIKNPCRSDVKKAIETCRSGGVEIKMITGDNVLIAQAIAIECGILEAGVQVSNGEVIEGEEFRNYADDERLKKVDSIRVMARSSPSDKLLMVECLKKKGHVVAVISHDTNDAPALKEAHIGISIGIQGTDDMANERSDIVILYGGFASAVNALMWGRCVQNNIQNFIQFQLTANVVALVINFVKATSAVGVPFIPVQQLCVNLIVNIYGALAFVTERPTEELMHKPPVDRDTPLITYAIWKNLLAQSLYQITILLTFEFRGRSIFDVNENVKNSIIFNTFVLCQVFNLLNARKEKNIFEGLHKKWLFIGIVGVAIFTQVVLIEFLNMFTGTKKLNVEQWGICITVAALSWPVGWFVKLIPILDTQFLSYIHRLVLL